MARGTYGDASIAAHKGAFIINDTNAHVIDASIIELSSDAVVTSLKHSGSDTNVRGSYITTPGSAIGGNGGTLTPVDGKSFTQIQLSAGTANWAK